MGVIEESKAPVIEVPDPLTNVFIAIGNQVLSDPLRVSSSNVHVDEWSAAICAH